MKAVVQRVASASVVVEEKTIGSIGQGYLILLGVGEGDTRETAQKLWAKIRDLRIMPDDAGKTNRSLADVLGEVLVVSQFTLYADCRHGRRPSFTAAGAPGLATSSMSIFVSWSVRIWVMFRRAALAPT